MKSTETTPNHNEMLMEWPDNGLNWIGYCPVCGAKERTIIHRGLKDLVFFCTQDKWTLYSCHGCGAGYLDPRPTPDSIGIAYNHYHTHKSAHLPFNTLGLFYRIRRVLSNGYRNHFFGIRKRPSSRLGVIFALLFPKWRRTIEAEGRHIPKTFPGAKLLDVGCGNGKFLKFATCLGWDATGIDPDPKAVELCRRSGLDVNEGDIDFFSGLKEIFDVITVSHVIEHVHDPLQLLKACYRLLKPLGKIWIETPNLNAQGHTRFGNAWRGLEPPRHLILFTRSSLIYAIRKAGFEYIYNSPYQPLCAYMYAHSKAIESQNCDQVTSRLSLKNRLSLINIERRAKLNPEIREFIALSALKSGQFGCG